MDRDLFSMVAMLPVVRAGPGDPGYGARLESVVKTKGVGAPEDGVLQAGSQSVEWAAGWAGLGGGWSRAGHGRARAGGRAGTGGAAGHSGATTVCGRRHHVSHHHPHGSTHSYSGRPTNTYTSWGTRG